MDEKGREKVGIKGKMVFKAKTGLRSRIE